MDLKTVSKTLQDKKQDLQKLGITRIGVFGSVARGESSLASDIDLLLDFDPQKKTYKNFYKSTELLEQLFGQNVDIVTSQAISPYIKPYIEKDVSYVQISN